MQAVIDKKITVLSLHYYYSDDVFAVLCAIKLTESHTQVLGVVGDAVVRLSLCALTSLTTDSTNSPGKWRRRRSVAPPGGNCMGQMIYVEKWSRAATSRISFTLAVISPSPSSCLFRTRTISLFFFRWPAKVYSAHYAVHLLSVADPDMIYDGLVWQPCFSVMLRCYFRFSVNLSFSFRFLAVREFLRRDIRQLQCAISVTYLRNKIRPGKTWTFQTILNFGLIHKKDF